MATSSGSAAADVVAVVYRRLARTLILEHALREQRLGAQQAQLEQQRLVVKRQGLRGPEFPQRDGTLLPSALLLGRRHM